MALMRAAGLEPIPVSSRARLSRKQNARLRLMLAMLKNT